MDPSDPSTSGKTGWGLRPGPRYRPQVTDILFLALVTGGYDPNICLWNPLVSKRPVWLMKGHRTSVTHILVKSKNSSILISISRDKVPSWSTPLPSISPVLFLRRL
jgi:hypothetical protein